MSENKNAKTPADDGKPVAWQFLGSAHFRRKIPAGSPARHWDPLYAAPPKREWVGLTLNEAEEFYDKYTDRAELINAIDKFLEEKNT